jgi:hypothetical protein
MGAEGGSGAVDVTSGSDCSWSALSNVSWITINSGAGSGNGTIAYSVAANTSVERAGLITVADKTHTVTQAAAPGCVYSIDPMSASVPNAGGSGSFAVFAPVGCTWTANSTVPWINLTSGETGTGDGTVAYAVAANSGAERSGAVTVAQFSHDVNQAGGQPTGSVVIVYSDQTNVSFAGGSTGVQAEIAVGEGLADSNAIKHSNLQIWDGTKRLVLPSAVDISSVQANDKLRISLDVSPGRSSNIHVYFNNDWQTALITPVLDQVVGYQTFEIEIGATIRERLGNAVNDIYFKAGSGFPDSGTLWVDEIQFVADSSPPPPPQPVSSATVDVYTDQTNVSFVGGSAGVEATIASGEGVGGSNAIKHTNLQMWDGTKRLKLPTPIDISPVAATDKFRISLDMSPGSASTIHIYFNNDWQTVLVTPVLDQTSGYQTFELEIGAEMRARLGNFVDEIYFKAGSGFPTSGTLWVDDMQFTTASSPASGTVADVYTDQTNVSFVGGSAGVSAMIAANEGVAGTNAIKHTELQIWDATKRLQLPSAVDVSSVLATDKLRISLDVSPGRSSTIHIYFNNDWETVLITPVLDQVEGYQTFDLDIGTTIRARLGNSVNDIYFKAGGGFPDSGTLWVDNIRFIRP